MRGAGGLCSSSFRSIVIIILVLFLREKMGNEGQQQPTNRAKGMCDVFK